MPADPITDVHAATARFPLPSPLNIGALEMTHREYAFVRVRTEGGREGKAFALSRDMPIAEIVRSVFAPRLIGADADVISARWTDMYRATIPIGRVGVVMRALSLLDIALWDVKAQRAAMPLWQLLGGLRPDLPVSMVAGYLSEGTRPAELAEELLRQASRGYALLKVARSSDPRLTSEVLGTVQPRLPDGSRLVVDGLWVWRTVREATEEITSWSCHEQLAWIEDPFPPEEVELCAAFRAASSVPLALGDELSDPHAFTALFSKGAVDVARVDATAIGGVTSALSVVHQANAAHVEISPHVYPEVHVHLAAALPGCVAVETFDPTGNNFDLSHKFVGGGPELIDGRMHAPEVPGLGYELDWEMIDQHA
ncbi:MAG TPA: mandelate racemase/muconate lactonizing enzyme family protein [Solirubrobacteraceae bacterium]|nr:mandelate racemase/muconate lactonizing enzyme family protein [Solirubrobacteraceae bacterium]